MTIKALYMHIIHYIKLKLSSATVVPTCSIVSFGAPVSNEYRLIVEGQAPISIRTSQVSLSVLYMEDFCANNRLILETACFFSAMAEPYYHYSCLSQ